MKIKCLFLSALFLIFILTDFAQRKTPTFTQHPVRVETIKNVKVNLKSHKMARTFRTNLRNAAKEGVNFAGHYILTTWGCGTNCSQSAIIDARNGRVFFPEPLGGIGIVFCDVNDENTEPLVFKPNSRLLILTGYIGGDLNQKNSSCGIYYFDWTGTNLKQIGFEKKQRSETP